MAENNNILSQDEVNALLKAVETGEIEIKKESGPRKNCVKYDFKNPSLLSKENKGILHALHDNFVRNLGLSLSAFLRTLVQVTMVSIEQITYNEFILSLPEFTCLNVVSLPPIKGQAIIELNVNMLILFIERLLGGEDKSGAALRPLTEIEIALTSKIMKRILEEYRSALRQIVEIEPVIDTMETDPRFVQVVKPDEMVVLVCFEISMGGASGILSICFPSLIFESLCSKLVVQSAAVTVKSRSEAGKAPRVRDALLDVPFVLHSILGETSLNVRDIISLQPGDVIRLNRQVNPDIQVNLDGRAAFKAKLAVRKARKIAFVTSRLI